MTRWLILILLFSPAPALAQTADDLFNGELLQEIRLDVHPYDWQQLEDNYLENTYYAADLHWVYNGRVLDVEQVGIRSRGTGSRNPVKPGLRVDFDRYKSNRQYLGLKSLVLRNNAQDASMLHERVTFAFMRRLGIPVPRTAHARLFVNGEYMGLYTVVESIDQVFLQDRFQDGEAHLYEYDYGRLDPPYFFEYRGDSPAHYFPKPFKPETHESDPQAERIVAMIRTINQVSDAQFESAVGEYLDWPAFIALLATEAYLAESDGIVGDFGLNNFYLYRQSATSRFQMLPWDRGQTFNSLNREALRNLHSNVLTRRAFLSGAAPRLRQMFEVALMNAAMTAGGPGGWLEQEIAREYNQVREAARQDTKKLCDFNQIGSLSPCTNENFEAAVAEMIQFARNRNARIGYSSP
jgi:spore coat protein CotH